MKLGLTCLAYAFVLYTTSVLLSLGCLHCTHRSFPGSLDLARVVRTWAAVFAVMATGLLIIAMGLNNGNLWGSGVSSSMLAYGSVILVLAVVRVVLGLRRSLRSPNFTDIWPASVEGGIPFLPSDGFRSQLQLTLVLHCWYGSPFKHLRDRTPAFDALTPLERARRLAHARLVRIPVSRG